MMVDEYTYSSLQIFQREIHPSVFKTGGSKEGLSLFGKFYYFIIVGFHLYHIWYLLLDLDFKDRAMSRISGLHNDMNKITFNKERKSTTDVLIS